MNSVNHIIKFLETTSGVSMQDSTKHTPFEAMFGRRARLPIDINAESSYCPEQKLSEFLDMSEPDIEETKATRSTVQELVKKNIKAAQIKQKNHYDRKHGAQSCFSIGSVVVKKDFTRKKRRGGKLDHRWTGPFVITASLGRGLYQLKEVNGSKVGGSRIVTEVLFKLDLACIIK